MLVGRLCTARLAVFLPVRGYDCWRVWFIMVWTTHLTLFPFGRMHTWLVQCWPALASVYGHVAAAAALGLVRGDLGRSMVGFVSLGSVALLPDVVCVAGSFVPAPVSRVLVHENAV